MGNDKFYILDGKPMTRERFLDQLRRWHDIGENQKVFDAVASIPCEERDYELNITLLQMYIYRCDGSKMEELRRWLESEPVKTMGESDTRWYYLFGLVVNYLVSIDAARPYFEKAVELDPDNFDAYLYSISIRIPPEEEGIRRWGGRKPTE